MNKALIVLAVVWPVLTVASLHYIRPASYSCRPEVLR